MDQAKLEALLETIGDVNDPDVPAPLVSLEEFFDGNDDGGSIWCNLPYAPSPAEVRKVLEGVRAQDDVHDVLIMVTQYDGEGSWPFSDTVVFVTSLEDEDEIADLLGANFGPDEIYTGLPERCEPYTPPKGMRVTTAWWD